MNPLRDAIYIIKKDWKLLAILNALYFCVLVIGATIALLSPGLHFSMVKLIGSDTIAGSSGIQEPSGLAGSLEAAGVYFLSSFLYVLIIALPSTVMPIWGPIIGGSRFFVWGVTYVAPLPGGMTLRHLLPQYVVMLVQGEAYILAVFGCIRQMAVALANMEMGLKWAIRRYMMAVGDSLKLLLIAVLLLAVAALYQAFLIPMLSGSP